MLSKEQLRIRTQAARTKLELPTTWLQNYSKTLEYIATNQTSGAWAAS